MQNISVYVSPVFSINIVVNSNSVAQTSYLEANGRSYRQFMET